MAIWQWTGTIRLGTSGQILLTGDGSPEGIITGSKGSLYLRVDGGIGTGLYVKESGASNTGWVATSSAVGAVTSIFGRAGAVSAQTGDYDFSMISGLIDVGQLPSLNYSQLTGAPILGTTDDRSSAVLSTSLDSSLDKAALIVTNPTTFPLGVAVNIDDSDNGGWDNGFYFYLWNKGTKAVTLLSVNAGDTFNGSSLYIAPPGASLLAVTDGSGNWTIVPWNYVNASDSSVLFSNNGVITGDGGLQWNNTLKALTLTQNLNTSVSPGAIGLTTSSSLTNNNNAIGPGVVGLYTSISYTGASTPTADATISNAIVSLVGDLNTDRIASLVGLELNAIGGHASAVYTSIIGLECIAATSTLGSCTTIQGIQTYWRGEGHSSTIGTAYGIHIKSPQNAASITITNNVALQIDSPTLAGATNNYAIKVSGGVSQFTGLASAIATKSSTYPVTANDATILCNGTFTVTLPTTGIVTGHTFRIKNIGSGTITISCAVNIDAATTKSLSVQYTSVDVQWDGTQYWILN